MCEIESHNDRLCPILVWCRARAVEFDRQVREKNLLQQISQHFQRPVVDRASMDVPHVLRQHMRSGQMGRRN